MFVVNQHNPGYDHHNHHVHTNHDKFKCRKPPTQSESTKMVPWRQGAHTFLPHSWSADTPCKWTSNMAGIFPLIPLLNHPNKNGQLIVLQSNMAMEIHWNIRFGKVEWTPVWLSIAMLDTGGSCSKMAWFLCIPCAVVSSWSWHVHIVACCKSFQANNFFNNTWKNVLVIHSPKDLWFCLKVGMA